MITLNCIAQDSGESELTESSTHRSACTRCDDELVACRHRAGDENRQKVQRKPEQLTNDNTVHVTMLVQ
jgi:hypothetical protein